MTKTTISFFAMAALVMAFTFGSGATYAETTHSPLNIAVLTNYPPFQFKDPASGALEGFDVELITAVAAKIGTRTNFVESSFSQFISSIQTKRVDLVANIMDLPERRASISFVDYLRANSVFFTLKANAARFPDIEALCGKRVGATRTTTLPALISKWSDEHCTKAGKPAITVIGNEGAPYTRLQLLQGAVDAGADVDSLLAHANLTEGNRFVTIGRPFESKFMGIGFSKDDPGFGQTIKKALAELIADGSYRRLLQKWNIPDDSAVQEPTINGQP